MLYDYVIRVVGTVGCYGLGLLVKANAMTARRRGDDLVTIDPKTGYPRRRSA